MQSFRGPHRIASKPKFGLGLVENLSCIWTCNEVYCLLWVTVFVGLKKPFVYVFTVLRFALMLVYTGLFISPFGISELDCATTKTGTTERSISIGRESLQVFFCTRGLGVLPGSTATG